jgi:hypothetical protein
LRPGSRFERLPATDPARAKAAPSVDWISTDASARARASGVKSPKTTSPTRAPPGASGFDPDRLSTPTAISPIEALAIEGPARPRARGTSTIERPVYEPDGEAHGRAQRPTFAAPRPTPPRDAARQFPGSPPDDRWPASPPATFAPPQGVEASPPRWDELAREQEEGRWSV